MEALSAIERKQIDDWKSIRKDASLEDLAESMKKAVSNFARFFERADISWEISMPIHREKGAPLTRKNGCLYSGNHFLCDESLLDEHTQSFLRYVIEKNGISIEDCPGNC